MLSTLLKVKVAGDIDKLYRIAKNIEGRTICAFGEAISWPVTSFIDLFRSEFDHYIEHGKSYLDMNEQRSKDAYRWDYE